jgi:hypothetical protein
MRASPSDFHICDCCGTEFGYDDAGRSHAVLRAEWLRGGLRWWNPVERPPTDWDPYTQVSLLGQISPEGSLRFAEGVLDRVLIGNGDTESTRTAPNSFTGFAPAPPPKFFYNLTATQRGREQDLLSSVPQVASGGGASALRGST